MQVANKRAQNPCFRRILLGKERSFELGTISIVAKGFSPNTQRLKSLLERAYKDFDQPEHRESDPVEFVWEYAQGTLEQEFVGWLAAMMAYGNVGVIRKTLAKVLDEFKSNRILLKYSDPSVGMGHPSFENNFSAFERLPKEAWSDLAYDFHKLKYRFNRGQDWLALAFAWQSVRRKYGSLGHLFKLSFDQAHENRSGVTTRGSGDSLDPLDRSLETVMVHLESEFADFYERSSIPKGRVDYFLTLPSRGGAVKRWHLFLRWMNRRDRIDPGTWITLGCALPTHVLKMPLDTHSARLSYYIGLNAKNSAKKADVDLITQSLLKINDSDPTRYDFTLSRLGILKRCQKKFVVDVCRSCPVVSCCRLAYRKIRPLLE